MANESRRTVSALVWLGGTLLAVGSLVLVLYGLYYFSVDFFESDDIPQGVKIAAPPRCPEPESSWLRSSFSDCGNVGTNALRRLNIDNSNYGWYPGDYSEAADRSRDG